MTDVGVVMPVYKQHPAFLEAALRSVLSQQYPHFALVIVADGAPPEVLTTIRGTVQNDPRVQIVILPENRGVAQALNRGFHELLNRPGIEYLTWVSSDNIYLPHFLLSLRAHLSAAPPEVGVVYSCFQEIDEAGTPLRDEAYLNERRKYQRREKQELLDFFFIGPSFMYKAAYARLIGGYGREPVEDYDYFLRLTEHCEVRYIPAVLMHYRANSSMSISARIRSSKEQRRRWRYMFQLVKQQARQRRSIPVETTVLFPVSEATQQIEEAYENLLEQYYSNYRLLVADQSPDGQASRMLRSIPDPRVGFVTAPKGGLAPLLQQISTPFVMVHQPDQKLEYYHLHTLAQSLRTAGEGVLFVYKTPSHPSPVMLSCRPTSPQPMPHRLYRTAGLRVPGNT